jgi:hypothetical protein
MNRLATDFLACLLIQLLVLAAPGIGQHAAMAADVGTGTICSGTGVAGPAETPHDDARACCQACTVPSLASAPRSLPARLEVLRAAALANHAREIAPGSGARIRYVIRGPPGAA